MATELRFPEGAPAYSVTVGAHVPVRSQEEADQALRKYQGALTPPEKRQIENWYVALRLATASGAKADSDEIARMSIYVAALSAYPADVVKAALDHFTRTPSAQTSWLPTLPEVLSVAERHVSSRRAMIAALTDWHPESEEDRCKDRIRDLLFTAAELDRSTFLMKRSAPEEWLKAQAKIKALRDEANRIRLGDD